MRQLSPNWRKKLGLKQRLASNVSGVSEAFFTISPKSSSWLRSWLRTCWKPCTKLRQNQKCFFQTGWYGQESWHRVSIFSFVGVTWRGVLDAAPVKQRVQHFRRWQVLLCRLYVLEKGHCVAMYFWTERVNERAECFAIHLK